MSVFEQIKSTAESAIQELDAEIIDLEGKIEAHQQRIQYAKIQIQSLKKFLNPEEPGHSAAKSHKAKNNGKANSETIDLQ